MANNGQNHFSRVLVYLSQYIIPVAIVPISLGIIYGYGAIRENNLEIKHDKGNIKKLESQTMINQISIRTVGEKVTAFETSLPLILKGISDIKYDMKGIKKDIGKMDVAIGILKDRENRRVPDNTSCVIK